MKKIAMGVRAAPARRAAAAVAASAALVGGLAGTANAQTTWPCNNGDLCTITVVNSAPMYVSGSMTGTIKFYLPLHTGVAISCWIGDYINGRDVNVRYLVSNGAFGAGWVWGAHVDTGHDPNPNVGYCS